MEVNRVESMARPMYRTLSVLTAVHLPREKLSEVVFLADPGHHGPRASVVKQVTNAASGPAQVWQNLASKAAGNGPEVVCGIR